MAGGVTVELLGDDILRSLRQMSLWDAVKMDYERPRDWNHGLTDDWGTLPSAGATRSYLYRATPDTWGYSHHQQIGFGLGLASVFLNSSTTPLPPDLTSKLFVPFYKYPIADLSWAYALVVVITVVFASNAINFADGLDGLAIVPSSFVIIVYGVFAYVLGNTIWSDYLQFDFLPGSQEVTVFCAALFGAGIGFLWFNAYPAEVFMGDAGSMALGGTIGTMAVLLKQEVLFLIAGGVFLAEIVSVVVQDWIGIQRLGRRVLFRAPLHHTFQYRGLAETKIAVRFWIVSGVLSLIALASLKVR